MATRRKSDENEGVSKRRPATTPEAQENQLISAAMKLAEQQIMQGTASSQVITHYLKLGSSREKIEQERIAKENSLLEAKIEAMASAKRVEELYEEALNAMRSYAGQDPVELDMGFDD